MIISSKRANAKAARKQVPKFHVEVQFCLVCQWNNVRTISVNLSYSAYVPLVFNHFA